MNNWEIYCYFNRAGALVNNSIVSETEIPLGDSITMTGAASGGRGAYKYAFYYKRSTASAWTTIGTEFGTAVTAKLKPLAAVKYDIKIVVKDSAGKTATKEFKITVTTTDEEPAADTTVNSYMAKNEFYTEG